VIDWGTSYKGYISDLTRTFAIGQVEPEFVQIARIVAEANAAGRATAGPGVAAGLVDNSSRCDRKGWLWRLLYHPHRSWDRHGSSRRAVHPLWQPAYPATQDGFYHRAGIYLPGRNGVRVEDDVVITPSGIECLSDLPRELRLLG